MFPASRCVNATLNQLPIQRGQVFVAGNQMLFLSFSSRITKNTKSRPPLVMRVVQMAVVRGGAFPALGASLGSSHTHHCRTCGSARGPIAACCDHCCRLHTCNSRVNNQAVTPPPHPVHLGFHRNACGLFREQKRCSRC